METVQTVWSRGDGWKRSPGELGFDAAGLVLVFGSGSALREKTLFAEIAAAFPGAVLAGCSTAGEICGERVHDESLAVTAVRFDHTEIKTVYGCFAEKKDVAELAGQLAGQMVGPGLVHVLVFSDGLEVNGTELAQGITSALPEGVSVSGGLAGDGSNFENTYVLCGTEPLRNAVCLVGFYSDRLEVGCGSMGGWDPFGPKRLVTSSDGNILYELDHKSALELYKTYLGDFADGLPASGLLFPLSMSVDGNEHSELVRTILGIDDLAKSMTFAGDIPEGSIVRFMKANKDRLIDGAQHAAEMSTSAVGGPADLALCVSCVGRKLVLGQRVEEEVEAVLSVLGAQAAATGYYSYGELSPIGGSGKCSLHNQTMTITVFREK
ncbi:FIST N-terminal domain-containing protein [Maridesulfovibrio sp.]|uniref:FIST signal transduction protein n=1 Tax=Maridesulfovibrio sp. TaxID=2795000 RepID=UPI002A18B62F|nr:FIST N-terminal domain-containing protein [Maridesulfovibrio sp.]